MREHFTRLIRAMAWADERALAAIRAADNPEALRLFAHALGAEEVWLSRVEGRPATLAVWPDLTIEQAAEASARNAAGWLALVERQPDDAWGRPITYRTTAGDELQTALSDIVTHVVIHGAYHRGQVARVLGPASVGTDFIIFTREAG